MVEEVEGTVFFRRSLQQRMSKTLRQRLWRQGGRIIRLINPHFWCQAQG